MVAVPVTPLEPTNAFGRSAVTKRAVANAQKQRALGLLFAVLFTCSHVLGFELVPQPTKLERELARQSSNIIFRFKFPAADFAAHRFSKPVHEGLVVLAYECPLGELAKCADPELSPNLGVLVGVRWNDDPPFQFAPKQGKYVGCPADKEPAAVISFSLYVDCWLLHFRDVSKIAAKDPSAYISGRGTLLSRSHYGDLQFLHAMASSKFQSPEVTKAKIMMWAEFMWRVQTGGDDRIAGKTPMGSVKVSGLAEHFPPTEMRTVSELFTVGRPWLRLQLKDIAFGSLLHLVQDSFAGGHVERRVFRNPSCGVPEIVEFHTYAGQDSDAHKQRDSLDAATSKTNVSMTADTQNLRDVLSRLILARDEDQSWGEIRPYLDECVFRLAPDVRVSSSRVTD